MRTTERRITKRAICKVATAAFFEKACSTFVGVSAAGGQQSSDSERLPVGVETDGHGQSSRAVLSCICLGRAKAASSACAEESVGIKGTAQGAHDGSCSERPEALK